MRSESQHYLAGVRIAASLVAGTPLVAVAGDLSAGGYHVVRVGTGSVLGIGDGTYGQLGVNPAGAPTTVTGLSDVTRVAAGGFSTLALKDDGTVWYLGESTLQHTTPHGTPNPVSTPVQVAGLAGIDAIAAGNRHYLALDSDTGDLYAWGHNGHGQVGDGGHLDVTTPVVVLTGVSTMDAGDAFSLAVKSDDSLWAWGRNAHGQLGVGDTADRLTPTQVTAITTAESVAAGGRHSLVLLTDNTLLATGDNEFGQLGLGTTTSTTTPTAVPGFSGIMAISAGYFHSAAFGSGSEVSVWGRNFEGQCGGGASSPVTYTTPQVLAGLPGTPTGVQCGYHFTLVELTDGLVAGIGSNSDGQLDGSSVADQDDSQKILQPQLVPVTPDLNPPLIDSLSPANGATDVEVDLALVLTMNEGIQKGAGSIRIRENLGNEIVAAIDIASTEVTVDGTGVLITLPSDLDNGTAYYVEMDHGAIEDVSGNAFAGIAGLSKWSFVTSVASASSLVAHWKLDDGSGTTALDSAGTDNTGTLNNSPIWVSGTVGGGLDFDGTNQSVSASLTGIPTGDSARTISLWFNADDINTLDMKLIGYGDGAGTTGTGGVDPDPFGDALSLSIEDNGLVYLRYSGGNNRYNLAGNTNLSADTWYHLVAVVPDIADPQSDDVLVYLNGALANTTLTGTVRDIFTDPTATVPDFYLGHNGSSGAYFDGTLDDVQIYDTALSATEIASLHGNPGSVVGGPVEDFESYISNPAFGLALGEQGFTQDPDGDRLANGLEACFGTAPGVFDAGLADLATDGITTTFTHPQNETQPADVIGFYDWSPNLVDWYPGDGVGGPVGGPTVTISVQTIAGISTVTATVSGQTDRVFFRAGAQEIP